MIENLPTIRPNKIKDLSFLDLFIIALVIYPVFPFMVMFDAVLEIYHQVAFRVYGVSLIDRKKYIFIDRQNLKKLNPVFKFNCMYCGYANGLMAYAKDIAAETEAFWCAVKHANKEAMLHQAHQQDFINREKFQ